MMKQNLNIIRELFTSISIALLSIFILLYVIPLSFGDFGGESFAGIVLGIFSGALISIVFGWILASPAIIFLAVPMSIFLYRNNCVKRWHWILMGMLCAAPMGFFWTFALHGDGLSLILLFTLGGLLTGVVLHWRLYKKKLSGME